MRVQTEIQHLQAKEGSLRRSQPADILTLDLQSPQLRNKFLLFEPPTLWCFIMAAQHGGLRTNEIYIYIYCFCLSLCKLYYILTVLQTKELGFPGGSVVKNLPAVQEIHV